MSNTIHWIESLVRYIDLQAGLNSVQKAGKIIFPKKKLKTKRF